MSQQRVSDEDLGMALASNLTVYGRVKLADLARDVMDERTAARDARAALAEQAATIARLKEENARLTAITEVGEDGLGMNPADWRLYNAEARSDRLQAELDQLRAGRVSDEMIARAMKAWGYAIDEKSKNKDHMRAALEAALSVTPTEKPEDER